MWQKFKDQLPAVIVTLLVIGVLVYWLHTRTVSQMAAQQQRDLATMRAQTSAEISSVTAGTRSQIDALNTLLKDAINQRSSDMFMTDEELATVNSERIEELATVIATKMQPVVAPPKSPEEAEQQESAQIDRVSSRLSQRLQPLLAQLSDNQEENREVLEGISAEISDQIAIILTSELSKNQILNNNLAESQALAAESLALSHELAALYLTSFDNDGVLTRLLTLPAGVLKDVSKLSIVNSTERQELEQELMAKLATMQERIDAIRANMPVADQ
ncbi:hypothetical protein [Synoicihabitans lomoniglobus]|uniref:Uncharacterized protein n=1 Tax=Synoicihabitans lomoniglobus TaxID=2909285 RepID=A0AAE9ZSS8_9BACT|nr:hypothetical protein [Opitutaceae bacterium LMO-M01]WED63601.1 hypothetical protein PXH66_14790 [Opitutaceae bacterium LMO-M01]